MARNKTNKPAKIAAPPFRGRTRSSLIVTKLIPTKAAPYDRSIFRSKKFFYLVVSVSLSVIFYLMNVVLITKYPYAAASYLSLFNTMMSFLAGLTSGILGIHTFLDYSTQASNAISNIASNQANPSTMLNTLYNFTNEEKRANVTASRTNTL